MAQRHGNETDDAKTVRDGRSISRRTYAALVGATLASGGLAGCSGSPDGGDGTGDETTEGGEDGEHEEELPEGVSEEEFESGPVPDAYTTAMSIGGEERNTDDLVTKSSVEFAEYDAATENDAHEAGTACGNCSEYIADKNGDGFGACAKVEGYVGLEDWCALYESLPEPEVPSGMTEDELATAEVPEAYRTASSQGNEARDPESLVTQESVNMMEAVDATVDGEAAPGQSCATCAEYIPDANGDGWGACAKVEGYVAVEDWCSIYEHVTEALEE